MTAEDPDTASIGNGEKVGNNEKFGHSGATPNSEKIRIAKDAANVDQADSALDPASARPRRVVLFVVAAFLVLALDVISKALVVKYLPYEPVQKQVRLLGGAIYLNQLRNSGAAFSLGTGFTVILTVVAVAVVVVLIRIAGRLRSTGWALAFGLILGGAIGNLIDRFFRSPGIGRGHVVDWISVFGPNAERWPVFNLADSGIVVGAILAGLLAVLGVEFDGRPRASAQHARDER